MKIICLKKYLKEAIILCERIAGKNLSLPVLSNILISGEGKIVKFIATNLEIGIEVLIPSNVEDRGEVAVPAGAVKNLLSSLPDDENITLELQNNNLSVFTAHTSSLIKSQLPDDFPALPKINNVNKKEIEVPVFDFINSLKSVWYSASFLNIKPEISSVYIFSDNENPLTFVATDSFRLAEKKLNYSFKDFGGILIPLKSVSEIIRVFDGKEGNLKIITDQNQIFIEKDNIKFISRLVDGVYVDYKQIIPNSFTTDVVVNKDIFINTLKTASVFIGKLNELKIKISSDISGSEGGSGSMVIKTSNTEVGEHTANISVNVTGEEIETTFNYRYIFECLQFILSPEIILRFSGENKPLVITGIDNSSFQYLVMPMNSI